MTGPPGPSMEGMHIDSSGMLSYAVGGVRRYASGQIIAPPGEVGPTGERGPPGESAPRIARVYLRGDGSNKLVVVFSDGSEVPVDGELVIPPAPTGAPGAPGIPEEPGPKGDKGDAPPHITDAYFNNNQLVFKTSDNKRLVTRGMVWGVTGDRGPGIARINQDSHHPNRATVVFENGTTSHLVLPRGVQGDRGERGADAPTIVDAFFQDNRLNLRLSDERVIPTKGHILAPRGLRGHTGHEGQTGRGIDAIDIIDGKLVFNMSDSTTISLDLPKCSGCSRRDGGAT